MREIRFLLLATFVIGFAVVVIQSLTEALSTWSCLLLACLALVLGQTATVLNQAQPEDPVTWNIENLVQRHMFWLLVFSFVVLAIKPYWETSKTSTVPANATGHSVQHPTEGSWTLCENGQKQEPQKASGPIDLQLTTALPTKNDGSAENPALDRMDKYASVGGLILAGIGLLMTLLTGWLIVMAVDFRTQLKDLQAASKVGEKIALAEKIIAAHDRKMRLDLQQREHEPQSPDFMMFDFALRSFQKAEAVLMTPSADLFKLVPLLKGAADDLRNGAEHVQPTTRQLLREYFVPSLEQMLQDSLSSTSHLRGAPGSDYRDALGALIRAVKAM